MRLSPMTFEVFAAPASLLVDRLVVLCSMMRLSEQFRRGTSLCSILIRGPRDFLSWPLYVAIVSEAHIRLFRSKSDHRELRCVSRPTYHSWLDRLRLRMNTKLCWAIGIHNVAVVTQSQRCTGTSFRCCCVSSLCCSRPLFSCKIFLGESLLSSLSFPIIIPNPSSIRNNPASKLSKHRLGCHNRNLS